MKVKQPSCEVCRQLATEPSTLDFACPVCGRRMLEISDQQLGGLLLHCPDHCATLIPSPSQIAAARAARN